MQGKRLGKLSVDTDQLKALFACSGLSERGIAKDVQENPSSVHRFLESGSGDAALVAKVLIRFGVARTDIPKLIKRKDVRRSAARLPPLNTPVDHRLLETLFMVGKIDFIRTKIAELRSSVAEGAEWAELMEAESLKWTGHFVAAQQKYEALSETTDPVIKVYALSGRLRIAREQRNDVACDAVIIQLKNSRKRLPLQLRAYVASFFQSMRAMKFQNDGKKAIALNLIQRAQGLARKSDLRVEPLKRMIERGIILRKQHLRTGATEDADEAVAQYFAAHAAAEAMNCFVYMSGALNGVARISEQEATNAEQAGDSANRKAKLLEADTLLEQASQLAELSEHAGMIAVAIGGWGIVKRRLGDFDRAISLSERSIDMESRMGRQAYAKIDQQNIDLAKARSIAFVVRD